MPPVFGPVSPSPSRLWSWAIGSATARVPSHSASSEHSGPVSRSSRRNGPTEAAASIAVRVAAGPSGTVTPLPPARPSSFTTTGRSSCVHQSMAAAASSKRAERGPGMPSESASSRAYDFDDSSRASAAVGPKQGTPRRAHSSATPSTSAALRAGEDEVGVGGVGIAQLRSEPYVVPVVAAGPGDRLLAPAAPDHQDPHQPATRSAPARSRERLHL